MSNIRDELLRTLQSGIPETESVIMVKKTILLNLLDIIPPSVFDAFLKGSLNSLIAPPIENSFFVTWVKKVMDVLNLKQVQLQESTGINQGDLSNFLKGKLPFGADRKTRIKLELEKRIKEAGLA